MKKLIIPIFLIFTVMFSCTKEDGVKEYLKVGDKVPPFTVHSPDGEIFSSGEFGGKRSVLIFFLSTCPDCHKVLPVIQQVWERLEDREDFTMAAVSRQESAATVEEYWNSCSFTMPVYLDPDRSVYEMFANMTVPRTYLVGEGSEIIWMEAGSLGLTASQIVDKLFPAE